MPMSPAFLLCYCLTFSPLLASFDRILVSWTHKVWVVFVVWMMNHLINPLCCLLPVINNALAYIALKVRIVWISIVIIVLHLLAWVLGFSFVKWDRHESIFYLFTTHVEQQSTRGSLFMKTESFSFHPGACSCYYGLATCIFLPSIDKYSCLFVLLFLGRVYSLSYKQWNKDQVIWDGLQSYWLWSAASDRTKEGALS